MRVLDIIVTTLLVVGAQNGGLVGIFGFNLVGTSALTRLIYTIVGLAGIYEVFTFTVGYEAMHHRWCDLSTAAKH